MQPFRVTCETCRARLKIREASVIGEIHACPRCGGMVHIIPPTGWATESAGEPATASAITAATTNIAPPAATVEPPPPQFADFAIDESLILPPSVAAASASSVNVASVPIIVPNAPAPVTTLAAPSFIQRALAQPILLWGGVGAAVVFAGGFTTAMLLMNGGDELAAQRSGRGPLPRAEIPASELADANPYRAAIEEERAKDTSHSQESPTNSAEPHEVARPVAAETATVSTAAPIANQLQLPELPPDEPPTKAAAQAADSTVEDPTATVASSTEVPNLPPPAPAGDERAPVLKFDPLDFDPLALGFSSGDPSAENIAKSSIADESPDALPPPAEDDANRPANDPGPAPVENQSITVQRGPSDGARPLLAAQEQLALPIDSIEMRGSSLARFVESMTDLAGMPITLDPLALAMAGTSPRDEVTVRARNTTLEKLLRDTLKEHRLDFAERDGQLVVIRPKTDARRSVNYELKDLTDDNDSAGQQATNLASLLERFVAPETWQAAGGQGTIDVDGTKLRVEQSHGVHYQALIFFERLRLARGLTPRSSYPAKRLSIESPDATLATPLGELTTFTFLPWTPLADVVQQWEEAAGVTILVDWPALAEVDLAPTSPISCSAIDRTWDEALTAILEPLGLAWRAVDGRTIQITSASAAGQLRTIEFYSIPQPLLDQFASPGALIESLLGELEKEMTTTPTQADDLSSVELEFDAPSGRLIALGNAAAHRYLTKRLRNPLGTTDVRATPIR